MPPPFSYFPASHEDLADVLLGKVFSMEGIVSGNGAEHQHQHQQQQQHPFAPLPPSAYMHQATLQQQAALHQQAQNMLFDLMPLSLDDPLPSPMYFSPALGALGVGTMADVAASHPIPFPFQSTAPAAEPSFQFSGAAVMGSQPGLGVSPHDAMLADVLSDVHTWPMRMQRTLSSPSLAMHISMHMSPLNHPHTFLP